MCFSGWLRHGFSLFGRFGHLCVMELADNACCCCNGSFKNSYRCFGNFGSSLVMYGFGKIGYGNAVCTCDAIFVN